MREKVGKGKKWGTPEEGPHSSEPYHRHGGGRTRSTLNMRHVKKKGRGKGNTSFFGKHTSFFLVYSRTHGGGDLGKGNTRGWGKDTCENRKVTYTPE